MALALVAGCVQPRGDDAATALREWGLPEDLELRQAQLTSLGLTGPVDRIGWVHSGLESLALRGTQLRTLERLPPALRKLDLCNSPIETLGALPQGLERLDLRLTALKEIGGLPEGLSVLAVGGQYLETIARLPSSLKQFELADSPALEARPQLPESVKVLALTGPGIDTLGPLPPTLETLAVMATAISSVEGLPASLRRLVLRRNQSLGSVAWPEGLVDLWVDELQQRSLGPLPETLRSLKLQRSAVGSPSGWPLSLRRLELYWVTMRWGEAPPLLDELVFHDSSLPPELPRNLSALRIGGRSAVTDEELNAAVPKIMALAGSLRELSLDRLPPGLNLAELGELRNLELNVIGDLTSPSLPGRLDELSIHGTIRELPELPLSLERIDLAGSVGVHVLPDLSSHKNLRELVVRNTELTTLPALPPDLRVLDVSGTGVASLAELPKELRSLTLHLGQVERLGELPATLRELVFVAADGYAPCPDLLVDDSPSER